jgi:hypothetical protein
MNGIEWLAARIIAATTVDKRAELRASSFPFDPSPLGAERPVGADEAAQEFMRSAPNSRFVLRIAAACSEAWRMSESRNPRPLGVIRPDSATAAVLRFLRQHAGVLWSRRDLVKRTGHTGKAVDWALLYLRAQGLIAAYGEDARNSRYLRYCALPTGGKEAA